MTDWRDNWRARHPERYAAQQAVTVALRTGRLQKEPCLFCDEERVQAHHHDYDLPLAVTWLCPWHHQLAHGRARQRKAA